MLRTTQKHLGWLVLYNWSCVINQAKADRQVATGIDTTLTLIQWVSYARYECLLITYPDNNKSSYGCVTNPHLSCFAEYQWPVCTHSMTWHSTQLLGTATLTGGVEKKPSTLFRKMNPLYVYGAESLQLLYSLQKNCRSNKGLMLNSLTDKSHFSVNISKPILKCIHCWLRWAHLSTWVSEGCTSYKCKIIYTAWQNNMSETKLTETSLSVIKYVTVVMRATLR